MVRKYSLVCFPNNSPKPKYIRCNFQSQNHAFRTTHEFLHLQLMAGFYRWLALNTQPMLSNLRQENHFLCYIKQALKNWPPFCLEVSFFRTSSSTVTDQTSSQQLTSLLPRSFFFLLYFFQHGHKWARFDFWVVLDVTIICFECVLLQRLRFCLSQRNFKMLTVI